MLTNRHVFLYNPVMRSCPTRLFSTLLLLLLTMPALAAPLPRLHAQGVQIVDARGRPVVLRGINLGGWLVEEPWMMPLATKPPEGSSLPPVKDHASLVAVLGKRFGAAGAARVQAAFRNAWLNESDFDRIRAAGLNCVRLPFLSSQIAEPASLAKIDQAVAWAGARGIYVILDMHGAPGSQSDQDHTGMAGRNEFFKDPINVTRAETIWTQVARRYRDNPAVAGYDLVNEPTGTPNSDTLYVVTDRLYRAVRAADPTHLVFIEDGYTGIQYMPFPGPCGWTNVVYSTHYYDFKAKSADDQANKSAEYIASVEKERQRRQVPFYVGEFGLEPGGKPETEAALIKAMDDQGMSWSQWTYKVIFGGPGGLTLWSLVGNAKPVVKLDPYRDSEAEWIAKSAQVRSENLAENEPLAQVFRASALPDARAAR
jgi:endoglucanase